MNLSKYLFAATIVLLAAGCEKSSAPGPEMPEIRLEPSVKNFTRAQGLDFKVGDHFGLYLISYQGETAPEFGTDRFKDNLMCTKTATGVELPRIYYPESGKLDFYAYYPYSVDGVSPADSPWIPHSVKANQSDPLFYDASDFLTAVTAGISPSQNAVPLVFSHRMSLVNVQLLPGAGLQVADLKNARMTTGTLASACRVNIATGEVSDTSGGVAIIPNGNQVSIESGKASLMSLIAVPQTIPVGTELFDITIGTKHYKYVTDRDLVLKSGFKYLMEITLKPSAPQAGARITAMPR